MHSQPLVEAPGRVQTRYYMEAPLSTVQAEYKDAHRYLRPLPHMHAGCARLLHSLSPDAHHKQTASPRDNVREGTKMRKSIPGEC
eukprot:6490506-Amphidinium_carterae.2